jgi:pyruvate,water dikinase
VSEYGWRSESWYKFHVPTWAEDETLLLAVIAQSLADPSRSPGDSFERSRVIREAAVREAEAALSDSSRTRFRELLTACNSHVAVSESRVRWQLELCGSVRVPILALGRRLVTAGVIEAPNDIFFLTLEQMQAAVRDEFPSRTEEVAASKREISRWELLAPPGFLGAPPQVSKAPPDLQALMRHLRGYGVEPSGDPSRINGTGASKGVARGQARVIDSLTDGHRLQPGDILVCRTTAPPWTSLFAIAGGVVTDAGGILSHTAICAREYGIPAVVATLVATEQIPDGAWITIDGEKGVVTIEG